MSDVLKFLTPDMQRELSRHNQGWRPGATDFEAYLRASELRYQLAFDALGGNRLDSLCDIGGFWGAFPVTLKRLGVPRVALTEALKYYSSSFDGLFSWIASQGVEVLDYDPFGQQEPGFGQFDAVTAMAVLEHYPHSLRGVLKNIQTVTSIGGMVYLEVPNIAYWPKRMALLRGDTPLVEVGDIFESDVPFTGHHHEFTVSELLDVCSRARLSVESLLAYNYSYPLPTSGWRASAVLRHPLMAAVYWSSPSTREILAVCCVREGTTS